MVYNHLMQEGVLETRNLTKRYGEKLAVDELNLSLTRGEVFGLLGPNGAGKTTTIRMMTCLTRQTSGTVEVCGFDTLTDPLAVKRRIAVVPQENNLDRDISVEENLNVYGRLYHVKNLHDAIERQLAECGLTDDRSRLAGKLSGGMQRRLLIARALLCDPEILFLDEPSVGLDPQIRRSIWEQIGRIRTSGHTVLLTTHYMEEADLLCDRIGILSQGRLVALDTPENLKKLVGGYVVERVSESGQSKRIHCETREECSQIVADTTGAATVRKASLEDVFLHLTGEELG